jgi:outer membrane protein assembly factor BamA
MNSRKQKNVDSRKLASKAIWFVVPSVFFCSCTALQFVPESEKLFTGSMLVVDKAPGTGRIGNVQHTSAEILRPKPNRKLAEEPVYLSKVRPEMVNKAIEANLYNHGFFDSKSNYTIRQQAKTAAVVYNLQLKKPYTIAEVRYPQGEAVLEKALLAQQQQSLLKIGSCYELNTLVTERQRLVEALKEEGFYFLSENDLLFSADSSFGHKQVIITLRVKPEAPPRAIRPFVVGSVSVFPDHEAGKDNSIEARLIDSVNYFSEINYVKPAPIIKSIFLKNGKTYSRTDHNLTYSRLMGLGIYKYVNLRLYKADSLSSSTLNVDILLMPFPKKSLSAEVQGVSKSNNFIGPGINFHFRNRNAFRGAELLIVGLRTSFETQINGPFRGQYTYEVNPRAELYVPRFLTPFNLGSRSMYVPRTRFSIDYNYLNRINYFAINSFKLGYGYKWKTTKAIDHDLGLLNVTYFNIGRQSDAFLQLLESNPILARRFQKQLIAGFNYSFFYNEQVLGHKRHPFYFNFNVESAGNGISAFKSWVQGQKPESANPLTVGEVKYSQFLRFDVDVRQYFYPEKQHDRAFALRMLTGFGLPYGNSATMPYIKHFFAGGAYSVRGFPAFSLGPGTFAPPDDLSSLFFLQQGGEIRLEANAEYRFPLFSVLKGAWFFDAGNTWLTNPNEQIPGGAFSRAFYKELAASVGAGLRADVQFFVFRVDLGMPIRKPWLPEGERITINQINPSSKDWRKRNLVLNLAFGYPF